jgi:hypothetical protein
MSVVGMFPAIGVTIGMLRTATALLVWFVVGRPRLWFGFVEWVAWSLLAGALFGLVAIYVFVGVYGLVGGKAGELPWLSGFVLAGSGAVFLACNWVDFHHQRFVVGELAWLVEAAFIALVASAYAYRHRRCAATRRERPWRLP